MGGRIATVIAGVMLASALISSPAALAQQHRDRPPPAYPYWQDRRDPPPGHEFRPHRDDERWDDRRSPPPNWDRESWRVRQDWLRRNGHDRDDHDSAAGLILGAILGFALGAAVVDSRDHQEQAEGRLNDPGWIAYCARRYRSFDPYTGTYLGYDGLRHYCR